MTSNDYKISFIMLKIQHRKVKLSKSKLSGLRERLELVSNAARDLCSLH